MKSYKVNTLYCLWKCLYHWEFMLATGEEYKERFFDCRKGSTYRKDKHPMHYCYCCTNAGQSYSPYRTDEIDCKVCALNGYAWNNIRGAYGCEKKGAPWRKFRMAQGVAVRKRNAQLMVNAIKAAIRDKVNEKSK